MIYSILNVVVGLILLGIIFYRYSSYPKRNRIIFGGCCILIATYFLVETLLREGFEGLFHY